MPRGYECDKCGSFQRIDDVLSARVGRPEAVDISRGEGASSVPIRTWTLCPECRRGLVGFVEGDGGAKA